MILIERSDMTSGGNGNNLIFLSSGTLAYGASALKIHYPLCYVSNSSSETNNRLHSFSRIPYYSRLRSFVNLLPFVQFAKGLQRVFSVYAGTKEENMDSNNFQAWNTGFGAAHSQVSTMIALSIQVLADSRPEVAFVHDFPGLIYTRIAREASVDLENSGHAFEYGCSRFRRAPFVSVNKDRVQCCQRCHGVEWSSIVVG